MKRMLFNSILVSSLAGTALLGCERSAKDRPLKDPAAVAAEKEKAAAAKKAADEAKTKAEAAAKKAEEDRAKAEAEAAAIKKAEEDKAAQAKAKAEADAAAAKKAEEDKAAQDRAKADEEARKLAEELGKDGNIPANPDGVGQKPKVDQPEEPANPVPEADRAAEAKKREDEANRALAEKRNSAKSIELDAAPAAVKASAGSLVKIFAPNPASTTKGALDYAKILGLSKGEKATINDVMAALMKSNRADKFLLLLGLQNCVASKVKAEDCKVLEKSFVKTGFLTAVEDASSVITTTAGFLDGYYKSIKSVLPKGTVDTVDKLKVFLSKEVKVLITRFVESSDGTQNYISDGTASAATAKVSLLSVSDDTLKAIFEGKYSEASVSPSQNIVTLKLNKKLEIQPLQMAKRQCADTTANSQESNIISYEPKVLANGKTPEKAGKNLVATGKTNPASADAVKNLKEKGKSLGISFADNSDSTALEKSLIISTTINKQGIAGSPILNDQGEYFGIVSSIGNANDAGAYSVYGACLDGAGGLPQGAGNNPK